MMMMKWRGLRELQQRMFLMLQACKNSKQLWQLHAQIVVNGFHHKNFLLAKLLSCCISCGHHDRASLVFRQAEQPTTTLYNLIVRDTSSPERAFLLYNSMRNHGGDAQPNEFTYSALLGACACTRQGQQVHARVVSAGYASNAFVQTALVAMYAADQGFRSARKVFDGMHQRKVASWNALLAGYMRSGDWRSASLLFDEMPERDVVSWTTMIAGYGQSGRSREALSLFSMMGKARIKPDQVAMIAGLSACSDVGDLELGRRMHARISIDGLIFVRSHSHRLITLNNSLIHMYMKCGDVDKGLRIFQDMRKRDAASWTTVISGLAMHGRGEEALQLFRVMQMQCNTKHKEEEEPLSLSPDGLTFIAVLHACGQTGRIEQGSRYFQLMTEDRTRGPPGVKHYGCMVNMLSRAGKLWEASRLIDRMPMRPTTAIWGALLGGCRMHSNVELGQYAASRLMELHPDEAANYLVLVSNIFEEAQMWECARKVREKMVDMGVCKPLGASWIHLVGWCPT